MSSHSRLLRFCSALLCAATLMGGLPPAQAQEDKKAARERETLRRAQQALREAQDQHAALQGEKTALEEKLKAANDKAGKLEAAEQKLAAAERRASGLGAELARAREANATQEKQLAEAREKYGKLGEEQTQALRTVASRDAQIKTQQGTLMQVRGEVAACEDKNVKLYGYGSELMQRYRDKGAFEAIRQGEPFTGLKQAQIDNVLEEYRDKIEAQRIRR